MKTHAKAKNLELGGGDTGRLNVLVVGATGGTGRATVQKLRNDGHNVTAFSRNASVLVDGAARLRAVDGDVTKLDDLDDAMQGQNVVIVTLGISENPLRVRFFGTASTPEDVRSAGTANVVESMHKHGVQRLVVQSSYGVGATRGLLRFADQLFFSLILKPQIADTEVQEQIVRDSGIEWVIAQPVHLTDEDSEVTPFVSTKGHTRLMKVARKSVAQFLARATSDSKYVGQSIAVSG